jgi:signal transduction histidine kinase
MDPNIIIRHAAKLSGHTSVNLFKSLMPPKTAQEQAAPFASTLAHEVRNPLTNINLAVEMLKSTLKEEDQQIYLDIILRGSGRINALVTDLLITCQGDDPQPAKHSFHQLLDEVLDINKDRITLKNIRVMKDYSTPDCKILVNKDKITIALTNIIINAIDAMSSKNGKLRLINRSENGKCVLEIVDNGIGINKADLENIFKPYFTNKAAGMGLGLSTTRSILLSNQVLMEVDSVEGKGTRFTLTFDKVKSSAHFLQSKPAQDMA